MDNAAVTNAATITGGSGGGALRSVSGANGYGGAITLTDDARINADAGTLTLSGAIAGTGTGVLGQSLTLGGAGNGTLSGTAAGNLAILRKDGAGTWTVTGRGTFDRNATVTGGTLRLQGGGTLSNLSAFVDAAGTAAAVVTGSGSTWTNSGNVFLGSSGAGTLTVAGGGWVQNTDDVIGGFDRLSTGTATVTGAGSTWTNSTGLTVELSLNLDMPSQVISFLSSLGCDARPSCCAGSATMCCRVGEWDRPRLDDPI